MPDLNLLKAALLGIVEGLTEFIPVSSTGHLILLVDLLQFSGPPGKFFEVVIQFGAIAAVCWVYRRRLVDLAVGIFRSPGARHFAAAILAGFLPAAVIGALGHRFIKDVLFSPWVVSVALIVGGLVIMLIERRLARPRVAAVEAIPIPLALAVGFCQALAMIPGVSRAGATIMGAMVLGVERKAATEFSFFLAIPTMLGAATYDLWKNRDAINADAALVVAVGFLAAFLAAMLVVRWVIAFVGRHGFVPFAWYRIAVGAAMLAILMLR